MRQCKKKPACAAFYTSAVSSGFPAQPFSLVPPPSAIRCSRALSFICQLSTIQIPGYGHDFPGSSSPCIQKLETRYCHLDTLRLRHSTTIVSIRKRMTPLGSYKRKKLTKFKVGAFGIGTTINGSFTSSPICL